METGKMVGVKGFEPAQKGYPGVVRGRRTGKRKGPVSLGAPVLPSIGPAIGPVTVSAKQRMTSRLFDAMVFHLHVLFSGYDVHSGDWMLVEDPNMRRKFVRYRLSPSAPWQEFDHPWEDASDAEMQQFYTLLEIRLKLLGCLS